VEKLKVAEKREKEWMTEGREEPKKMNRKQEVGAFLKRLFGEQEKQWWKAMKKKQEGSSSCCM
jgi:hypothetical protein